MKIEEAIEFLDDIFSKSKNPKCNLANLNKIIYLLESIQFLEAENKAYKEMWEELKEYYGDRKAIPQAQMYLSAEEKYITNCVLYKSISEIMEELEKIYLKGGD